MRGNSATVSGLTPEQLDGGSLFAAPRPSRTRFAVFAMRREEPVTRASAASTCARGAHSRSKLQNMGSGSTPRVRLAAPAVQGVEAVVVRVGRLGRHRGDVEQLAADLLAQP